MFHLTSRLTAASGALLAATLGFHATAAAQGWSGYDTLVGDVNGDGRDDLIWNETGTGNRTWVGLGGVNGDLNFRPVQEHP